MTKRIFIAIHYLEIGGAERSLIGLLNALDYSKYEVDLFVYQHRGEFMDLIPKEVNLLPEISSYAAIEKPLKNALKEGHLGVATGRWIAKQKANSFRKNHPGKDSLAKFQYVHTFVSPFLPSLKKYGEYDLAISFLIPHNIVRDKVKAKQKWAWIHTDYSFLELDTKVELPVWAAYDKIISISEDVTKGFLLKFPSLENKILLMENILSEQFVREQADCCLKFKDESLRPKTLNLKPSAKQKVPVPVNVPVDPTFNHHPSTINLLSIGRFSYAKAFDRAVYICKQINYQLSTIGHGSLVATSPSSGGNTKERDVIINYPLKVRWYIVGYGGEENKIRKAIANTGMEDYFILLGKQLNPYPFIKACDIYVQPSRYEGKSVTVREAQILCKPVVITNYATASSQVQDGVDGIIVPNDIEGAAEGIVAFIQDKDKQEKITHYLQNHHYGNEDEVKKIDAYI